VVSKRHVGLYVESKQTNVESKLFLQLLLCGFNICLFLLDWTATIDPTELLTCRGSFGGFKSTCFQLDRQLESKPPEFPTLAVTDSCHVKSNFRRSNFTDIELAEN
jgi:hypothetical protein